MTNIVPLSSADVVRVAVSHLKQGEVIGLPTDTVYGLAADLSNTKAVRDICEIKGRDSQKPIAVCVGSVDDVRRLAYVDDLPKGLLSALLPGPVTLLLDPIPELKKISGPRSTRVGIRVPDFPFIRQVAEHFQYGLALTSANESDSPSCLEPIEFKTLWPFLGLIVDGGRVGVDGSRTGSTIVDLSERGKFQIVREGSALFSTLAILRDHGLGPAER
ncbi:Telomere recombination [Nesidiocoris tenuis]|uniref:Threonylcarbamoyl-AMP synthase n=1 Tax=Nesidiocoris tenuis TaxID=355587 RepID=A0ABN7B0G5_9HEMI|nr:Telomere recombination [Nesidiocoris tenuis]